MAALVLTNVTDGLLQELQVRAAHHRRSPEEEAAAILRDALQGSRAQDWEQVDAIHEKLGGSGRSFSDSTDLVREDRDR
ncbi:MAG: hypothetical protein SFU86_18175 [Pirellulaceae bacterium]|nr:hypothetical protein [Pirellulaceae bacterium]